MASVHRLSALRVSVRRLAQKSWSAFSISRLYRLPIADVRAMLADPPPPAPRLELAPSAAPAVDAWRYQDDAPPIAPPAAELVDQVDDQVEPESPPPPREPWVGTSSPHATRKRSLSDEQALEVCRDRANGLSMYAMARKYGVSRNTLYAILDRNHSPALPSSDAARPESAQ
jgi:helix-turn-helix, Psq domain